MSENGEIELKLAIDPADVAAFRRLPLLREKCIGGPTRRKLLNVYFDTLGLALSHHAIALRLRKSGGKWLQTLKTAGVSTGGMHQRGEWEFALPAPQLDLAMFRETPLATLAQAKALHLTLKPVFRTDFDRTTWIIELAPGQRVEVALDQGIIRAGGHESVISEIEIDLLEGSTAAAFDVALALVKGVAMRPAIRSKAERGFLLFRPQAPVARRARPIELRREWTPNDAMRTITAACLDHYEANVEGALDSNDPEYVHQLRVALRRLRSAIHIFRPAHADHVSAELKWLANTMGAARDWDVLATSTLPALFGPNKKSAAARKLLAAAAQRQALARDDARAALVSGRAAMLVMTLARWVHITADFALLPDEAANHGDDMTVPASQDLTRFASHKINRSYRRVARSKDALVDMAPDARHRLRIKAKHLRYALEFFSSLFPAKRVVQYVKALGRIQDGLGATNDDAVALRLIGELAPAKALADLLDVRIAAHTQSTLVKTDSHMERLKKIRRFWMH